jgi:predicted nuclease of predicted toxin-antitoxin system
MKLLFDQNLSPKLVQKLADLFPGSIHTEPLGCGLDSDSGIWDFAKSEGFTIVTKDGDFADILSARGFPPKVVLVQLGNCSTDAVEAALRSDQNAIKELDVRRDKGLLILL